MQGLPIGKLIPWKSLALLVAGLILTVLLIVHYGAGMIGEQIASLGTTLVAILVISFFWYFLQTSAWQIAIEEKVPFWSLFKIKVGTSALNSIAPFSLVRGDPIGFDKMRKQFEVKSGSGALVKDRAVFSLASFSLIIAGLILGFLNIETIHPVLRYGVPAATTALLIALIIQMRSVKQGRYAKLFMTLRSCWGLCKGSPALLGKYNETDQQFRELCEKRPGAFYQMFFLHLLCQGLGIIEIYLIGQALLPEFTPVMALALAAIASLLSKVLAIVPGTLGVMEGLFACLVAAFIGPAAAVVGVTIVLVRRIRAIIWLILGAIAAGNPFGMFLGK